MKNKILVLLLLLSLVISGGGKVIYAKEVVGYGDLKDSFFRITASPYFFGNFADRSSSNSFKGVSPFISGYFGRGFQKNYQWDVGIEFKRSAINSKYDGELGVESYGIGGGINRNLDYGFYVSPEAFVNFTRLSNPNSKLYFNYDYNLSIGVTIGKEWQIKKGSPHKMGLALNFRNTFLGLRLMGMSANMNTVGLLFSYTYY